MFVSASLGTKPWARCIFFLFFIFFLSKRLCATQLLLLLFYCIFIAFLGFFFPWFFSFFLWIIKMIFYKADEHSKEAPNIVWTHQTCSFINYILICLKINGDVLVVFAVTNIDLFSVCGCQLRNVMDQIFQTFWKPKSMVGVQKSIAIFGISIDSFECIQAILCLV